MNKMNRRGFFTRLAQVTGAAVFAPAIIQSVMTSTARAEQKRAARPGSEAGLPKVDVNDPTAKAVGYVEDFKKVPAAKGNKCSNCSFYAKKEMKDGKEYGTCTIFAGKVVAAEGYCNSWNKKA